ncbi:hypothetical protein HY085_00875 [Candidatus Gottesmanbacteria bacterium]|nr:hypothetical protein [Candidatus Gottesmanbacteria bacterium]
MLKRQKRKKRDSENFQYLSLPLKTVKTSKNETLFDDAFAIYKVTMIKDQNTKMQLKNGVKWFSLEEIKLFSNCWPEIDLCILKKNTHSYLTYEFISDYILN